MKSASPSLLLRLGKSVLCWHRGVNLEMAGCVPVSREGLCPVHSHKGAELSCPCTPALTFSDSGAPSCNLALNVMLYYFCIFI